MHFDRWLAALIVRSCCRCGKSGLSALCSACVRRGAAVRSTPGGLPIYTAGPFEDPLSSRVRRFKYQDQTVLAAHLGAALAPLVPGAFREATLVPVPLHPLRLAERGYNQSALLAKVLARRLKMPVQFSWLCRQTYWTPQVSLDRKARQENVRGAFSLRGEPPRSKSGQTTVVLVDDVMTTGATLDACAATISASGAFVLGGLCCALGGEAEGEC